jgi:hypothetical protein
MFGHCNCMAGLGEVCSHVGAILFYLETTARLSGQSQCTQEKCSWIVPAFQKTIPYLPISKIDFSSAKSKMKSINAAINTPMQAASLQPQASTTCIATCSTSIKMSNEQCQESRRRLQIFYSDLNKCGTKKIQW